ncbi:MAG TPA: (Fe-S)-binding protein [Phycisphaerae bacterium]|nr:(Fe-S)-binding protein [Phycisphaerae bacterium]
MTENRATLPGLDCGLCGFRRCEEFMEQLAQKPELLDRCIHLRGLEPVAGTIGADAEPGTAVMAPQGAMAVAPGDGGTRILRKPATVSLPTYQESNWRDSLGREFDFYLEHFPEEPGPREAILPHNPMIAREMSVQPGDILIGRPLGMSCGCPITHCGVVMDVDPRIGLINWCVTGPLRARQTGYKDLGYYVAEAYEGLIRQARGEIRIGMRYFFQPRMCMLQWRHSGLVNYLNRTKDGLQVRVEGLWIG